MWLCARHDRSSNGRFYYLAEDAVCDSLYCFSFILSLGTDIFRWKSFQVKRLECKFRSLNVQSMILQQVKQVKTG